jgi:soluble lytic murein transglycosylase-like protein
MNDTQRMVMLILAGMLLLLSWAKAPAAEWKEDELRHYAHITAAAYHIEPFSLLEAVCEQESHFKLGQKSHKGAIGVCQIKPDTVRMINRGQDPYAGIGKTFQLGSTGSDVARIQGALNDSGFHLDIDGVFGTDTASAVRDFQRKTKLVVDGIVGRNTANMLGVTGIGSVTIQSALRHPPTNIMWAAEVLTWCRSYLGRDEPGVLLACYYAGPGGQVTRYLKEVLDRVDRLGGGRE